MNIPSLPEKTTLSQPPKLLDQVVAKIRFKHYSRRTGLSYAHWIKRYILFNGKRHPKVMGAQEIESFLSALATDLNVSASTQNLALSSILFLYREVLGIDLPWLDNIVRAKKPQRLPTVLSEAEVNGCSPAWKECRVWWRACCMERECVLKCEFVFFKSGHSAGADIINLG